MEIRVQNNVEIIDWAVGDAPLSGTGLSGNGLAAAIGNFDGVHLATNASLLLPWCAAKASGLTPAVVTFNPHPREFFRQDDAPFRLTDRQEKDRLLVDQLGLLSRRGLFMCALMIA